VKFAFIAKHRGIWPARWMCGAFGVARGGFYAWPTRPPSHRSRSDDELRTRVRTSFIGSDRTYGARRIWKDVLADGVSCGLHRIERLMREQALRAGPRRRRLPSDSGERQASAVAPNVLDRSFTAPGTQSALDCRLHLHLDDRRLALCCRRDRSVLAPGRRLVDEREHDSRARH
jgi:putative transposase